MMPARRAFQPWERRERPRRQPSLLGAALVIAGCLMVLNLMFPAAFHGFWSALAYWPLLLIAGGVLVLVWKPVWLRRLDLSAPQIGGAFARPRRVAGAVLIGLGALLLPFTLHVLDERFLGAGLLILLGVLLIWRRVR